jgi:hypothetical protein
MKRISFLLLITMMMAACTRQPDEQESLEKFSRQVTELQQGMSAKEAQWKQRFSSLPMGNVLVPDNLVAPEGRASGKATLKQFRELIAERPLHGKLGQSSYNELSRLFLTKIYGEVHALASIPVTRNRSDRRRRWTKLNCNLSMPMRPSSIGANGKESV